MQILVDPLRPGDDPSYFRQLHQLLGQGTGCCEVIAFNAERSGLPAPTSFLLDGNGSLLTTRSIAAEPIELTDSIRADLPVLADRPRPRAAHGVAYLPSLSRCRLLIVGGGHVGQAVGNLAADLDFDVWVVDDRAEYVSSQRFPRASRLICGEITATLKDLEISPDTYCIIVTRGHNHDEEALLHLAERGARYVGMIGSKRKIKLIFDDLEEAGISPQSLAKVYAPLGIEIGSQTVPEIAISILAELIAHRNLQGEVPGRSPGVMASVDVTPD
jgi:xanthine dehydrogenase accessory factor